MSPAEIGVYIACVIPIIGAIMAVKLKRLSDKNGIK
jgi:hypothetical protein